MTSRVNDLRGRIYAAAQGRDAGQQEESSGAAGLRGGPAALRTPQFVPTALAVTGAVLRQEDTGLGADRMQPTGLYLFGVTTELWKETSPCSVLPRAKALGTQAKSQLCSYFIFRREVLGKHRLCWSKVRPH